MVHVNKVQKDGVDVRRMIVALLDVLRFIEDDKQVVVPPYATRMDSKLAG